MPAKKKSISPKTPKKKPKAKASALKKPKKKARKTPVPFGELKAMAISAFGHNYSSDAFDFNY